MRQTSLGASTIPRSLLHHSPAKIHIVETDTEILFVEPAQLLKNVFAHASHRHSRKILLQNGAIEIATML